MCGINGFNFKNEALIRKMMKATEHRGPDGQGFFADQSISLGHNLLAITEKPDKARQPLISPQGNVLIYNGEIYNYKDLREELKRRGRQFYTDGDSEVLLAGLEREGREFIKKLNGMFAFAFYNKAGKKIILARDPLGMKPLYYYYQNGKFIFSSEMRGLLEHGIERKLDFDSLAVFFEIGYLPGYRTLIKDVFKLSPGEAAELNLANGQLEKFWIVSRETAGRESFNKDKLRQLMNEAVFAHTMGLRPFGLYLSGGLDSTVVLFELLNKGIKNLTTYSVRFEVTDPKFNEDADLAARLSRDFTTNHHELLVTENDFVEALPRTIEIIEEPRYHPSIPAYYLMNQQASKETVVILTGDGGDELFMGYPKYYENLIYEKRYRRYPKTLLNLYYQIKYGRRLDKPLERWYQLNAIAGKKGSRTIDYLYSISAPAITNPLPDLGNSLAELDRLFWLAEDSFIITDKLAMNFGMEGRFPYVDQRLVTYANAVASQEKLAAAGSKGLIRQAYKELLPDYILAKKKSGWTAPIGHWLRGQLGNFVREVLTAGYYPETAGLFNWKDINRNYPPPAITSPGGIHKKFFPILTFQLWARQFKIRL